MGMCLCKENDRETFVSPQFDLLVEECLKDFGSLVDNASNCTNLKIQRDLRPRAIEPRIWIALIKAVVRGVPIEHPTGPTLIQVVLSLNHIPTVDALLLVADMMTHSLRRTPSEERNLCVILCCLVERLPGPRSVALLSKTSLGHLIRNLNNEGIHPEVMLFSLIGLEKLVQKNDNTTKQKLSMVTDNLSVRLKRHSNSEDFMLRQIGFYAKWWLDNYFEIEGRQCFYENVNVMLNTVYVTKYLKICAEGLEARCDASLCESVRCTYQVSSGCWYYECLIITPGVMQIGWTTKDDPNYLRHEGRGVGDDQYSISFDGCRRLVWFNNKPKTCYLPTWTVGSIVGCLLDLDAQEVIFSLNGIDGGVWKLVFDSAGDGFYAAASFMSFQQCRFNFGSEPFSYPPRNRAFNSFNRHAVLKP